MQKIRPSTTKKKIPDVLKVIGSILILLSLWAWAAGLDLGDIIYYFFEPGIRGRYYLTTRRWISNHQMVSIEGALQHYKKAIGKYPSTSEGLDALMVNKENNDKWIGPYLKKYDRNDPWGYPYHYKLNADGTCEIITYGADGLPGGLSKNKDMTYPACEQKQ